MDLTEQVELLIEEYGVKEVIAEARRQFQKTRPPCYCGGCNDPRNCPRHGIRRD